MIAQYKVWDIFYGLSYLQELRLGDPPDVAGWPAYYLEPQFYQLWINSATLPEKSDTTSWLLSKNGYRTNGEVVKVDLIEMAKSVTVPSNPNILIQEWTEFLFPNSITDTQLTQLKEVLIPGLPDFEWTVEWTKYIEDETDEEQKEAIENSLRALFYHIFKMAEYQLS